MPGATSEAPPEPPAEMTPSGSPCRPSQSGESFRHRRDRGAAVGTEHRRAAARMVERDLLRRDVGAERLAATSRHRRDARAGPPATMMSLRKRSSSPLVSSVPTTSTAGGPGGREPRGRAGAPRVFEARNADRDRARRRLDAGDRRRLRPARRQDRVGDIDARRRVRRRGAAAARRPPRDAASARSGASE